MKPSSVILGIIYIWSLGSESNRLYLFKYLIAFWRYSKLSLNSHNHLLQLQHNAHLYFNFRWQWSNTNHLVAQQISQLVFNRCSLHSSIEENGYLIFKVLSLLEILHLLLESICFVLLLTYQLFLTYKLWQVLHLVDLLPFEESFKLNSSSFFSRWQKLQNFFINFIIELYPAIWLRMIESNYLNHFGLRQSNLHLSVYQIRQSAILNSLLGLGTILESWAEIPHNNRSSGYIYKLSNYSYSSIVIK